MIPLTVDLLPEIQAAVCDPLFWRIQVRNPIDEVKADSGIITPDLNRLHGCVLQDYPPTPEILDISGQTDLFTKGRGFKGIGLGKLTFDPVLPIGLDSGIE